MFYKKQILPALCTLYWIENSIHSFFIYPLLRLKNFGHFPFFLCLYTMLFTIPDTIFDFLSFFIFTHEVSILNLKNFKFPPLLHFFLDHRIIIYRISLLQVNILIPIIYILSIRTQYRNFKFFYFFTPPILTILKVLN